MKKMKKVTKYNLPMNEIIDTGSSEIVEKFLDVSEIENEKNKSLVRIDINMIEYPLFTKSTRKKKNQIIRYFFNRSKEAYIQVNPTAGDYIPGELEERVFISLLKIMRDKRYNNMFYTTISEILSNMGIVSESFKGFYGRITKALIRLSQTSYTFKNSLYSNKIKGIIEEQINTNIMNIHMISIKQAKESEKELFVDGRIKEIIKVSISEHFYDNIIRKGYLVYDSQLLLSMDNPITRALYMLINKLRFNQVYIKVLSINLIKRIPLSENIQKIGRTIKTIEKSCIDLKKMNLIENYGIIKNSKWLESEFEFYFNKNHNELKQNYFYDDKNHFDNLLITHTDSGISLKNDANKHFEAIKAETVDRIPTNEKVEQVLKILPSKARELKTFPKAIKDGIRQYGFEYIILVAEYMKIQKVTNIRTYFLQALSKGWAEDYIAQKKQKNTTQTAKIENLTLLEAIPKKVEEKKDYTKVKQYLESVSKEQLEIIEKDVYNDYIKMCGSEGKIQKMAFNVAKNTLIRDYVFKHFDEYTAEKDKKQKINNFEIPDKEKKEKLIGKNNSKNEKFKYTAQVDKKEKLDMIIENAKEFNINENSNDITDLKTEKVSSIKEKVDLKQKVNNLKKKYTAPMDKNINIEKEYKNISMFQLDILKFLDGKNKKEVDNLIRLLGITGFFEGELDDLHIIFKYNENEKSIIKINCKKGH